MLGDLGRGKRSGGGEEGIGRDGFPDLSKVNRA